MNPSTRPLSPRYSRPSSRPASSRLPPPSRPSSPISLPSTPLSRPASPFSAREFSGVCSVAPDDISDSNFSSHPFNESVSPTASSPSSSRKPIVHSGARIVSFSRRKQHRLLNELRSIALTDDNEIVGLADAFWLVACLHARFGDPTRAIVLASNYLAWRQSVLYHHTLTSALPHPVVSLLTTGVFTLASNRAKDASPVLIVSYSACHHVSSLTNHATLTVAILFEYLLRKYPIAMNVGITIIEDLSNLSLSSSHLRVLRRLTRALTTCFPVRIAAVYMLHPKRSVRTAARFLSPFLTRKYRAPVVVIERASRDKLWQYFDTAQIPTFLNVGGTMPWTARHQRQMTATIVHAAAQWPVASRVKGAQ